MTTFFNQFGKGLSTGQAGAARSVAERMRSTAIAAFAIAACAGAASVQAQPAGKAAAGPLKLLVHSVDEQQQSVTMPLDRAVRMKVGKSIIVELAEPAAGVAIESVAIAAQEIAEATVIFDTQVQVNAKKPGTTRLTLWTKDRRHRMIDIDVDAGGVSRMTETAMKEDMQRLEGELEAQIRRAFPQADVKVQVIHDRLFRIQKVMLNGIVPSPTAAKSIEAIAAAFVAAQKPTPDSQDVTVINTGGAQGGAPGMQKAGQAMGASKEKPEEKVVNNMTVGGEQQVLLRCTVAEVSKRAVRELGINGWMAGDNFRDMFAVNQIAGINPVNIGAAANQNVAQPLVFLTDQNGLPLLTTPSLSIGFPRLQMQLFFQAMRENDLVRVLAEPNLVAVAGQEANFLAGGEFPVPEPQASGTGGVTITIRYKRFGVLMAFMATPVGRDKIRLRVMPEVSDLDPNNSVPIPGTGLSVPGLSVRRAETTIELASGSTIAIAGLLSEQVRGAAQKMPALGDVPVLGALFSSVRYQKQQTELVILVTPELATAMNPDQVAPVPGQFMTDPNDFQLFGLGLLEGEPEPDPDARELAVKTDVPTRVRKWTAPPTQMSLHGPWGAAEEAEAK